MPPSISAAIARLHAAMARVANGDATAIKALYSHSAEATSFYGWGGYEKGWEAVSQRWDWAARQFRGGTVGYQSLTVVASDSLFYTTDIESFEVRMSGLEQPARWSNRVTHIFRFEDGEWRLLHRHGNRLEERYEPAGRLASPSLPES
jgi:ketosteroid isomerase-like protein